MPKGESQAFRTEPDGRQRVALFLFDRGNDYQAEIEKSARDAAVRHKLDLSVYDASGNANLQLEQIVSVIRSAAAVRPVSAIVHPVFDGMQKAIAREAARDGIGWALLNRENDYISDLRTLHPRLPIFSVTPDQNAIGRAQGLIVKALLPGPGRVLCIDGPRATSSARLRREGMEDVLHSSGLQVMHIHGDWTVESGSRAIRSWEGYLDGAPLGASGSWTFLPDVVVCHNDAMAEGARRELGEVALRRNMPGLACIPVIGCDGTARGIQMVSEGTIAATVVVPPTAGPAIEALALHARTHSIPEERVRLSVKTYPDLAILRPPPPCCPDCGLAVLGPGHDCPALGS